MIGIDKLHKGAFNAMRQQQQPDGTVIVTLSKRGERVLYRFCVKDLYGPDEEVLWEEQKPV